MPVTESAQHGARLDRIAGAAIVAFGACVAWASLEYPFGTLAEPGPGALPCVLALTLAAFGAVLALRGSVVRGGRTVRFDDFPHALVLLAVLGAAAFAIERVGYRLTVAAMLLFLLAVIERRSIVASCLLAAGMALGSFYLINDVLRVPLPTGAWGF
jgi:putative tricarboxylic transport membrane protein